MNNPFHSYVHNNLTLYVWWFKWETLTVKRTNSIRYFKNELKPRVSCFLQWLVGLFLGTRQGTKSYIVPSNDPTIHRKMILDQKHNTARTRTQTARSEIQSSNNQSTAQPGSCSNCQLQDLNEIIAENLFQLCILPWSQGVALGCWKANIYSIISDGLTDFFYFFCCCSTTLLFTLQSNRIKHYAWKTYLSRVQDQIASRSLYRGFFLASQLRNPFAVRLHVSALIASPFSKVLKFNWTLESRHEVIQF